MNQTNRMETCKMKPGEIKQRLLIWWFQNKGILATVFHRCIYNLLTPGWPCSMWWAPKKRIDAASAAAGYGLANVVLRQFSTGKALLLCFLVAAFFGWEASWSIKWWLSLFWQMSHLRVGVKWYSKRKKTMRTKSKKILQHAFKKGKNE